MMEKVQEKAIPNWSTRQHVVYETACLVLKLISLTPAKVTWSDFMKVRYKLTEVVAYLL
jgi:hypothetical protein